MKFSTDATDLLNEPIVENFATERASLSLAPLRLNTSSLTKMLDAVATVILVIIVISGRSGTDQA